MLLGVFTAAVVLGAALLLAGWRQLQALVWGGRLPGRLGALPVEETGPEGAPRGFKAAQLLLSPDGRRVRLAGVAMGGLYEVEDGAVCILGRGHEPPHLACECGFYAFAARREAADLLGRRLGFDQEVVVETLCSVDLAGTVIVCERGYRAGWQRVLDVGVLPWCAACAGRGILEAAAALGADAPPAPVPRLTGHGQLAAEALDRLHPAARQRREWAALRPLCGSCAAETPPGGTVLGLVELTGALGTEVGWLEPDLVPPHRVLAAHRGSHRWPA